MSRASHPHVHSVDDSGYACFFDDSATTEIYTLSLHDALPIYRCDRPRDIRPARFQGPGRPARSEEHTSELQSRVELVCRLLLEKKNDAGPVCDASVEQEDFSGPNIAGPCARACSHRSSR